MRNGFPRIDSGAADRNRVTAQCAAAARVDGSRVSGLIARVTIRHGEKNATGAEAPATRCQIAREAVNKPRPMRRAICAERANFLTKKIGGDTAVARVALARWHGDSGGLFTSRVIPCEYAYAIPKHIRGCIFQPSASRRCRRSVRWAQFGESLGNLAMDERQVFANVLRQLRVNRGLSQPQLAKATGLPQPTISRYEAGATEPGLNALRKLAPFFEVSIDTLCGLASPPDKLKPGNWLIDTDALEDWQQRRKGSGTTWAVAIPDRFRIVTSSQYQKLRDEVHGKGKR